MQSKLKQNLNRFFSSRNGIDELGLVSIIISIILAVLGYFFPEIYALYISSLLLFSYSMFRIFSKNILLRERENTAFCNLFKFKKKAKRQKTIKVKKQKAPKVKKVKKDKNFLYKNCPHCNSELKVSKKIKGERNIMCTKCYNEFKIKV